MGAHFEKQKVCTAAQLMFGTSATEHWLGGCYVNLQGSVEQVYNMDSLHFILKSRTLYAFFHLE